MQSVVIIDYGSGNLHSAAKAFERASADCNAHAQILVASDPRVLKTADRIVLPGVGAYADCKRGLEAVPGLREALEQRVRRDAVPFLGICVGMQLMAKSGHEFEVTEGFGWIDGEVRAITPADPALKIPHMGWNTLTARRDHALLAGIPTGPNGLHAYFVHSFHMTVQNRAEVIAETDYGGPVTAIVGEGNIAGTQFHPEKSQALGLRLIANFLTWTP